MSAPKIKNDTFFMGLVIIAILISAFLLSISMASLPTLGIDGTGDNGSGGSGDGTTNGQSGTTNSTGNQSGTSNSSKPNISSEGCKKCTISCKGKPNLSTKLVLEIYGTTDTSYLRSMAAGKYENGQWSMGSDDYAVSYSGTYIPQELSIYSNKMQSSVYIKVADEWSGFVPTIYHTNQLELENIQLEYYPSQQIFYSTDSFMGRYNVAFTHFDFESNLLANTQLAPQNSSSIYLQLPDSLRNHVQSILNDIQISSYTNSYSKIVAVQSYLQNNYVYDVNFTVAPEGHDPVEWFLFTEKRGVCGNFNSAFVVLLRAAGIPSRMVSGYLINSQIDYQEVIEKQSHAWAEIEFDKIGWVEFDATGSGSMPSGTSPTLVPTYTTITSLTPSANKGGVFSIEGRVTAANGANPSGLEVIISIMEHKEGTGLVCGTTQVTNGYFKTECIVPITINVGDYNIVAKTTTGNGYKGSESDPILKVNSETKITATAPQVAFTNKAVTIGTLLMEKQAQIPLENAPITVEYTVDGQQKLLTSTTNASGYTSFKIQTPSTPVNMSYTLRFNGVNYYLPSSLQGFLEIQQADSQQSNDNSGSTTVNDPILIYVSIPLALVVAFSAIFLVKRQKKAIVIHKQAENNQFVPITTKPIAEEKRELAIVFPQIIQPFPDVWGQNDSLAISIIMKKPITPQTGTLTVNIPGFETETPTFNDDRTAALDLPIPKKGVHTITAEYVDNQTNAQYNSSRIIRIVDYTEEIVSIYNETFQYAKTMGATIGEETTPREFKSKLQELFTSIDSQSLERLVSLFEIADYSLLVLQRKHYEEMFLASLSIKTSTIKETKK
jgi:transglutaminase-like putative cysteine protease